MKKAILSILAMGLMLASCDTSTKDSYQTLPYTECNLIVDVANPTNLAQSSVSNYSVKNNISQSTVDIKCEDLVINNQKYTFATDTMKYRLSYFPIEINGEKAGVEKVSFSKKGQVSLGSSVSNLEGYTAYSYVSLSSSLLAPTFNVGLMPRLMLNYSINDTYRVQTFWPIALYLGQSSVWSSGESYGTKETRYIVDINFEKKLAKVYVYNLQFSAQDKDTPKVILMEDVPFLYSSDSFYLSAAAPKTTVLTIKDGKTTMEASAEYSVKDFSLEMTSLDLTDASISYKIAERNVSFQGSNTAKPSN